jgi:hypothetical protein
MRAELQPALDAARMLDVDEVAEFCADLEQIKITALGILMKPAPPAPDRLIDIQELASRLGVSKDFVYRNKKKYAGFEKTQGGRLLWSSAGLDAFLRKQR